MGKFGRKVCCNFNEDIKCILIVRGHKSCVFEETSETQKKNDERQFGVCFMLPLNERERVLETFKKTGASTLRSWNE